MKTRVLFFLVAAMVALPHPVQAQKKYGMFDAGHRFDPALFVVFVDKQYTQNGVMDNDAYFMSAERLNGERIFFAGAQSDVKTIGGPFSTVEEMAAAIPDKATVWTTDMTRFVAKPAGEPASQKSGVSGLTDPPGNQPLKNNILADLSPDVMSDSEDSQGRGGGGRGGGAGAGGAGNRRRVQIPPLPTLLFGMSPSVGEVRGRVFAVKPDGSLNYVLGSFDIINGDTLRIFPAGGDTIHISPDDLPAPDTLETTYVHYATTRGGGQAAIPRDDMTRSSGKLNFSLTGGPTVDAQMQQTHVAVAHGPPGGTIATMEQRLTPFPVRFVPDP